MFPTTGIGWIPDLFYGLGFMKKLPSLKEYSVALHEYVTSIVPITVFVFGDDWRRMCGPKLEKDNLHFGFTSQFLTSTFLISLYFFCWRVVKIVLTACDR